MENHNIIINNYTNNETICFSYLLLKGTILTDYKSSCNKLLNKTLTIDCNSNKNTIQLYNNKFKAIIKLNLGINKVYLNYCCYTREFIINYKPKNTEFCVVPVYIIFKNHTGEFQAPKNENNSVTSACERISVGVHLIQTLIAEKFYDSGYLRKTFQLENDLNDLIPNCRIFRSKLKLEQARAMKSEELWSYFGKELMSSEFRNEYYKFLAFISCTKYNGENFGPDTSHDDILKMTEAHAALGGGGLAIFGTACLYTWPENIDTIFDYFQNDTKVDKTKFMDDSCYRGTIGGCFATTLGSVCHELCHTFDLGHTNEGVMGRGFDNIDKEFIFENFKLKWTKTKNNPQCSTQQYKNIVVNISVAQNKDNIKYVPPILKNRDVFSKNDKNGIYWTPNCNILLYYHRWLNVTPIEKHVLEFQNNYKSIYSSAGIAMVEIRDVNTEMLINWWDFTKSFDKIFEIPKLDVSAYILIAEDCVGNILKETFDLGKVQLKTSTGVAEILSIMTFFSTIQHQFPDMEDNKLDTDKFLKASLEVIRLIEQLGKVFAPVKIDMKNNVDKLYSVYYENVNEHKYLHDMLLIEKELNINKATISLQWLRRALHLILHLFECVVNDHINNIKSEDIGEFLREAYLETLEPYHGWVTQKLFHFLYKMCPNRQQFFNYLSNDNDEEGVISDMKVFNLRLRNCITNLIDFYNEQNIETTNRV